MKEQPPRIFRGGYAFLISAIIFDVDDSTVAVDLEDILSHLKVNVLDVIVVVIVLGYMVTYVLVVFLT